MRGSCRSAHRLQLFGERGERAGARLLAEGGAGLLQRAATGRARHTLVIERPPRRTTVRAQHRWPSWRPVSRPDNGGGTWGVVVTRGAPPPSAPGGEWAERPAGRAARPLPPAPPRPPP